MSSVIKRDQYTVLNSILKRNLENDNIELILTPRNFDLAFQASYIGKDETIKKEDLDLYFSYGIERVEYKIITDVKK